MLLSLNSCLLKTFLINKAFGFTCARFLYVTFKHLFPEWNLQIQIRSLIFLVSVRRKSFGSQGLQSTVQMTYFALFLRRQLEGTHSKLALYKTYKTFTWEVGQACQVAEVQNLPFFLLSKLSTWR